MAANLVLFDIDGTLLDTQDAGILAYERAGRDVHGAVFTFVDVPIHGRLDPENYADAVTRHCPGVDASAHEAAFQAAYGRELSASADEMGGFRPCPGVARLLDRLREEPSVQLGLLTGNWAATGRLKLERAGLDPDLFGCNAFAEHGSHRDELVPVARRHFREMHGAAPARVVVIGDTPRDVGCAIAGGAESLAVATGIFAVDRLAEAGATRSVADLADTEAIVSFLVDPGAVAG